MWLFSVTDFDTKQPIPNASFNYKYCSVVGAPGLYVLGYKAWMPPVVYGTVVQVTAPDYESANVTVPPQTTSSWLSDVDGVVAVALKKWAQVITGSWD
jgi:hypothetical protein